MRWASTGVAAWMWLTSTGALGCAGPSDSVAPPSGGESVQLDFTAFLDDVAPLLTAHGCDQGGDCHGGGIRGTFELSPLEEKDLDFDFSQVRLQVDAVDPDRSPLLSKPLEEAAGGEAHSFEPFSSKADPDYQAIRTWIVSASTGVARAVQGGDALEAPSHDRQSNGTFATSSSSVPSLNSELPFFEVLGRGAVPSDATGDRPATPLEATAEEEGLEYLVPQLEGKTFHMSAEGPDFFRRLSFSPAAGKMGAEPLYSFRVGYNPNRWLGYEASIGHNPGQSVHALFHMLNATVRYPVPFRLQPYGVLGFGMVMVFPGELLNANPVTKNAMAFGGGLELFLRDDLALRFEMRRTVVPGTDPNDQSSAVYEYGEGTLGFSFYRKLGS